VQVRKFQSHVTDREGHGDEMDKQTKDVAVEEGGTADVAGSVQSQCPDDVRALWRGPFDNPNWEAEHESALRWTRDEKGTPTMSAELPYRVPKQRWMLETDRGMMWVDRVY
jgi:hypothetical protein